MAKIHDLFIIELAEVIKGYGNDPDVEDPFRLSEFYRFYELPNIAVSRENFEKMRPAQPEPAIPLSWIEGQIEWLKSLDNAFSTLTAGQISAMVNKWKDEQDGRFNQQAGGD